MSDRNLDSLSDVQNVLVTITGNIGSGRGVVFNLLKEVLEKTGASVVEVVDFQLIINYKPLRVHVSDK